jgi:hypothetical protein
VDRRGLRIGGDFRVGQRRQRLVVDLDQLAAVFRLGARARHHGAHRFAGPAGAIHRNGRLRRGFEPLEMGEDADPRRHHLRQFRASDDRDYTGRFLGLVRLDRFEPRMGVRRAHKGDMRHPGQHDVADILPAALGEAAQIRARHRAPDIRVRPVERGEGGRTVVGDFHFLPRSCATDSIASTMA